MIVVAVDASYRRGWACLAAVADGHDPIVCTFTACRDSTHAEVLAVRAAFDQVEALGWERVTFLTDSTAAVGRCDAAPVGWLLRHASRAEVQLAHELARGELRAHRPWRLGA